MLEIEVSRVFHSQGRIARCSFSSHNYRHPSRGSSFVTSSRWYSALDLTITSASMVESSEQSVATPGSATGSNNTRNSAPKDKKCRYCGQAFTSSSLGRHLDLYIKAKNPKPPDGIHKIEEIRRLRGSVTRRHTRISTKSETPKTPPVAASSPDAHHENQLASNASAPTEAVSEGGIEFNRMDWQATGVINGLPPRTTVDAGVEPSRNVSRHRQLKSGLEQRQVSSEDQVMLKATQLALKEVLWSIKEAT